MGLRLKYINAIALPLAIGCFCYGSYNTAKDAKNCKSVNEIKTEIAKKSPKLYDSLMNDKVQRLSYQDWQYEFNKMNDSIKADSIAQKAYFEGAQMVRDSIKNSRKRKRNGI
jgi:hypothetical protein